MHFLGFPSRAAGPGARRWAQMGALGRSSRRDERLCAAASARDFDEDVDDDAGTPRMAEGAAPRKKRGLGPV